MPAYRRAIATDMSGDWSPEYRTMMPAGIPLGRFGTPEDIAQTAVFLAAGMADYITGEAINVNGGSYMD